MCSLFYITQLYAQQYISLCADSTTCTNDGLPSRSVEYAGNDIIVTYGFDNAIISEEHLFPNSYIWEYKGFGLIDIVGKPSLPIRKDAFALSQYTSIEIIDTSYIEFPMEIAPARPPLMDNDVAIHTLENVDSITSYSGFYPTEIILPQELEYYKNEGLLWVNIYPLQYDTEHKVVRAYTKIKYKITISDEDMNSNQLSSDNKNNTFINNIVLNKNISYQNRASGYIEDNQDYLIISTTKFKDVCNIFAHWKRTLGFRTHVILQDSWSSTEVKNKVEMFYKTLGVNLNYILIIGDENNVPAIYKNTADIGHITDLYYGCMGDNNDKLPDIYRGRIPFNSPLDALNAIEKIIKYEKAPVLDTLFYKTGLNCAFFEDKDNDGYEDRRFVQTSEEIKYNLSLQDKIVNRVYYAKENTNPTNWHYGDYGNGATIPTYLQRPNFAWDGNANDINEYINNGAFYILYRGHGEFDSWTNPFYMTFDVESLSNSDKLPVIFSITCLTGKYNINLECLAEHFLKYKNKGCSGIIAATEVSPSFYNDAFTTGMFDAIWPESGFSIDFNDFNNNNGVINTQPSYELGKILDQGILSMKTAFQDDETALYTHEIYHCFGDPSMQLLTETPKQIETPEISRINNIINVKLIDGNARVSFYNLDTNDVDTYWGDNIEYATTTENLSICISRHNYIPYITTSANTIFIQNETINEDREYNATNIKIGSNVTDKKAQGEVVFNSGTINLNGKNVIFAPGTTIRTGAKVNVTQP